MKKFWSSGFCFLLIFATACDEPEVQDEVDEVQEVEHQLEEESQEDESAGDGDEEEPQEDESAGDGEELDEMITEQEKRSKAALCDRPFDCIEQDDDLDELEGFTRQECYEEQVISDEEREFLAKQDREVLENCAKTDRELTECLLEVDCEDNFAFIRSAQDSKHVCAEETEAQMEACGFYFAWEAQQRTGAGEDQRE